MMDHVIKRSIHQFLYNNKLNSVIRLTQNQNESINLTVWSCCPKRLFCFTISTCDQLNTVEKGKGYQGIKTIKTSEYKNTRSGVKCCDHWRKEKQCVKSTYIPMPQKHFQIN